MISDIELELALAAELVCKCANYACDKLTLKSFDVSLIFIVLIIIALTLTLSSKLGQQDKRPLNNRKQMGKTRVDWVLLVASCWLNISLRLSVGELTSRCTFPIAENQLTTH